MEINIGGIQCDAKDCTYEDDSVKVENYESYLNKPCPNCGANLLTQADLDTVNILMEVTNDPVIEAMEKMFKALGDEEVTVECRMNGTGKLTIDEKKELNNNADTVKKKLSKSLKSFSLSSLMSKILSIIKR